MPNRPQMNSNSFSFSDDEIRDIITNAGCAEKLVDFAERLGKHLATVNKATTTQMRNAYGTMKKLELNVWSNKTARELQLLKPRLAYAAGRHGHGVEDLQKIITKAIDSIGNSEENFINFCKFFEAIIAYHKYHGGE